MKLNRKYHETAQLILAAMDKTITPEQFAMLDQRLSDDPELVQFYIRFIGLQSQLRYSRELFVDLPADGFDNELWDMLLADQRNAEAVEPLPVEMPPAVQPVQSVSFPYRVNKTSLYAAVMSMAAILMLALFAWFAPTRGGQEVATVDDCMDACWADVKTPPEKGTRIQAGKTPLVLTDGYIGLHFDNNARVVIEAPAQFTVRGEDRLDLQYGKMYATISSEAVGFSVTTPHGKVIDLGTKFGVCVSGTGQTDVQTYQGTVSIMTVSPQQTLQREIIVQGQARRIVSKGRIDSIAFQQDAFARDFNSDTRVVWHGQDLSLADVVSGGTGFERPRKNVGIDQESGRLVVRNRENWHVKSDTACYIAVPEVPYVDGVFVPNGEGGPVQLTSAGHWYNDFEDTNGKYYMPIGSYSHVMKKNVGEQTVCLRQIALAGFDPSDAVNLCVHANSGITFDLQAIRRAMPFARITGFSSVYGIPFFAEHSEVVDVDFYVFVDGQLRRFREGMTDRQEPESLDVALTETDRFLTLVCTQGERNYGDWGLFVNAFLTLQEQPENARNSKQL